MSQPAKASQAEVPVENVTVGYRLECDGTVQADPESECTGTQKTAKWVTVTVNDKYEPLFGDLQRVLLELREDDGDGHAHGDDADAPRERARGTTARSTARRKRM